MADTLPDFPLFDVDDAELAFGASADRYYGGRGYEAGKDASYAISRQLRGEIDAANSLFFKGGKLTDYGREVRPELDAAKVHRAIRALLSSWGPSHQQKEATVALAIHHWTQPTSKARERTDFGADRALVASQSSHSSVSRPKASITAKGATSTLDAFAAKWGVSVDLTPLARQEQAFNDMVANARKLDGSFEAARDRFQAVIRNSFEEQ